MYIISPLFNQIKSKVFIKPFVHQLIPQSAVQKPSLKPQTASNAGVEARWLGKPGKLVEKKFSFTTANWPR